jgi:formate dehydrogenase subunit gamma
VSRFRDWDSESAERIIGELKEMDGACLPILHALQEEFGYIHDEAIPLIADALNLSRAEVVGVLHFYHDFKTEPRGEHVLKVCRAESCQAMGGEALVDHLEGRLGAIIGETTPDGAFSLEAVYCLGNCALSPALMLDNRLYGRVSPQKADSLLEAAR